MPEQDPDQLRHQIDRQAENVFDTNVSSIKWLQDFSFSSFFYDLKAML